MAGTAPAEGTLQTARVPVQCYREVFPAKSAAMHRHLRASVLDPKRASPRAWQDRLRDPSLTVLLVLQLFLLFVALPLAATGVPIAAPVAWLLLLVAVFRRRGRFVANAEREQESMLRTKMLAWLLHLHGRRLRQEPPPRRGAEGLQQIGRFEHSLIKRNRKFVDSPLEGGGFELSVPREVPFASPRHPEPSHGGSVSKVQPTGIKQVASSSDISTMRSSPMAIWAR